MKEMAMREAEKYIPEQYRGAFSVAKGFYGSDPEEAKKMAEGYVPEEYKGYFNAGMQAYDKALELKKQKDEMQLKMFEKVIDPIWVKYDPEGKGNISKDQCQVMAEGCLEEMKMSQYFN
jgi:hypothetical protein